jgi:hypothetical protein
VGIVPFVVAHVGGLGIDGEPFEITLGCEAKLISLKYVIKGVKRKHIYNPFVQLETFL